MLAPIPLATAFKSGAIVCCIVTPPVISGNPLPAWKELGLPAHAL
jgi:hypothetical protein